MFGDRNGTGVVRGALAANEQEGKRAGCGREFAFGDFDADHIVAKKGKGGAGHKDNLQLLRPRHNRRKGKAEMSELTAKLIEERVGRYA